MTTGQSRFIEGKVEETLVDMHQNPVRAALAGRPCDWPRSSARYDVRPNVGVPVGRLD